MVVAKRLCQARLMQPGNLGPARAVLSSAPSPTSLLGSASSAYMQRLAFAHRRLLTTSVRASAVKPGRETPAWVSRILTDAEKEALIERHAIQLPTVCCGCGVKLQRTDPEAPGHFIVPAKLFEPFRTEGPVGAADDGEPVDEAEAERRALDQQLEALMQRERQKTLTPSPSKAAAAGEGEPDQPDVLCARCHSLRHHFRVRDPHLEGELPEFDLGKKVGRKIFLQKDRKAVVLCVVDITDFDGSLPTLALRALYPPGSETAPEAGLKFSLFMAANKFDLLPPAVTPARIEAWCRQRLKDAGLPHVEKVRWC